MRTKLRSKENYAWASTSQKGFPEGKLSKTNWSWIRTDSRDHGCTHCTQLTLRKALGKARIPCKQPSRVNPVCSVLDWLKHLNPTTKSAAEAHKQVHSPSRSWQATALCSGASLPSVSKGCSCPVTLKRCLESTDGICVWARTAGLGHAP